MTWLVDAHVHFHPTFGWRDFLQGAIDAAERVDREPGGALLLLLADPGGADSLQALLDGGYRELPDPWVLAEGTPRGATLVHPHTARTVILLAGRQIRARHRLELLALDTAHHPPDGRPLGDSVREALDLGALPVLPWAFGKWQGRRRGIVTEVVDRFAGDGLHLGDNGNRPRGLPLPPLFRRGRERGARTLPGSDPLPFRGHARRAGSLGFLLPGAPDPNDPGQSLRSAIRTMGGDPPVTGTRRGWTAFAADQLRMQLRRGRT